MKQPQGNCGAGCESMLPQILSGHDGVTEVAGYRGSEFVLSAIVGAAGLVPTISAIQGWKDNRTCK